MIPSFLVSFISLCFPLRTHLTTLHPPIQSLTYELEDREKRCAKLITQGQLFSEKIASSELIRGQQEDKLAEFQVGLNDKSLCIH